MRGGRVLRAALGHHVDLHEQAEGRDRDRDEDEHHGRAQARPGDVRELAPRARAVHPRGLVELFGDGLQSREPDDHVEADGLPDRQHDDRAAAPCSGLFSQSAPDQSAEREGVDHRVDQAVLLVHELPQDRHHDDRGDDRDEEDHPEGGDPAHAAVDEHRQQQPEAGLHRHDDEREDDGVADRLHEHRVGGEGADEVVEPDEARRVRRDEPRVGERQREGEDHGDDEEQDEEDAGGGDHPESGPCLAALDGAEATEGAPRFFGGDRRWSDSHGRSL